MNDYDLYLAAQARMETCFQAGDEAGMLSAWSDLEVIKSKHSGYPPEQPKETCETQN